mgnify:CR=1 FL=1
MLARISYARYVITFRFNYYYRSAEDKQWRSKLNLRTSCRNLHFPWEFIRVVYRALIPFCLLRAFYVSFSFIILPATARNKLLRAWFTTLSGEEGTRRDTFHASTFIARHSFCYVTEQFLEPRSRCVTLPSSRHVARAITYSRGVRREKRNARYDYAFPLR